MNSCRLLAKSSLRVVSAAVLLALASHGAAADSKPKIAFLLKTMQEERYQTDRRDFIAAAEKLGAEVQFDSAGNDEERQLEEFDVALDSGAKTIVLQPVDTGTAGAMVAKANARGVRVVGYDSMLTNGPLDVMVMQDSWAVGTLQADAMVAWLQKKYGKVVGNIVLIMGQPGDSNAQALSSGVYEMLAKNPGVKLLAQRSHADWSPDAARATADTMLLKYPGQIDAFICNNSGLAYGVMQSLQSAGLDDASKVFVAGADADLRNVRLVARDKQSLEVWKEIEPLADKAAEVAVTLANNPNKAVKDLIQGYALRNNGKVDVPTFVTPVVAVTKETIDATVIAGGLYTRMQIYGD
jgi:D-xylose transport system substrate-binding protein